MTGQNGSNAIDSCYPLVSAILPTRGRKALAKRAFECWYAQTWPNKELVIADDKEDKSFNRTEIIGQENIRYYSFPGRLTIGEKRNLCAQFSYGEYIVHFDSDDWSASDRIADQMAHLRASGQAVTGYHHMLFTDGAVWWRFDGQVFSGIPKGRFGVFGTSLLYRKDWWKTHRFIAGPKHFRDYEDHAFVVAALQNRQLLEVPAGDRMVARIHADNTSPKGISKQWTEIRDDAVLKPLRMAGVGF